MANFVKFIEISSNSFISQPFLAVLGLVLTGKPVRVTGTGPHGYGYGYASKYPRVTRAIAYLLSIQWTLVAYPCVGPIIHP